MACVEFVEFCFTAGDDVFINFQYLEDDGETPIDLTGATAEMQLLEAINSVSETITLTGGITDPVNGAGEFSLTDVESQSLLPIPVGPDEPDSKQYVSKMRFTFSDGTKKSVMGARVTIEQSGIR